MWDSKILFIAPVALAAALATPASASSMGNWGTLGANGVVTASPDGGTYGYVSTDGGIEGAGALPGVGGTTGSVYESSSFFANAGSMLQYYFNYVTSDGAGYADYAWAALRPETGDDIILFTARTTTSGDTVPGFDLPGLAPGVVLDPGSTPIIGGAPTWSALGGSSGSCWSAGCGYTGWIQANYSIVDEGNYTLVFGVTNWSDSGYQSGLAFDGLTIDDEPIDPTPPVPEPATWAMMIGGFALVGSTMRRRKLRVTFA